MKYQIPGMTPTRTIHPKILYFGTPVVLLTTLNADNTTNITPMSSAWALGNHIVLGLSEYGHGMQNLQRHKECVVNIPNPALWTQVEALASLTGANPVPNPKLGTFRFEKNKFTAAGLTSIHSDHVLPDRIAECPIQIEAAVIDIRMTGREIRFGIIEVEAVTIHAHDDIVSDDRHVDPARWSPLIYNFRHYFDLGDEVGKTFRAEV